MALGQNSNGRRHGKWLTARAVFFIVSFSFHGRPFLLWSFHKRFFVIDNTGYRFFATFILRCLSQVATILTFVWGFLLSYSSAGVLEPYPILIHCETKPYRCTFSNYTLSLYIFEIYLILIQYWTIPYLNSLPNITPNLYITELYPIIIHYRIIPYLNTLRPTIHYLNTLPNYSLLYHITEFYPILIHFRSIFSYCIESEQKTVSVGVKINHWRHN